MCININYQTYRCNIYKYAIKNRSDINIEYQLDTMYTKLFVEK